MGREIRRVPVNFKHPKRLATRYVRGQCVLVDEFQPMFDRSYRKELQEWEDGKARWDAGEKEEGYSHLTWEEWDGERPDPDYYFPEFTEPCDGWCVYETVSEGTPVTPVFETAEELIDYLVENGDFWDQKRRKEGNSFINCDPWSRDQAEKFVKGYGWKPSLMMVNGEVKRLPDD